MRKWEERYKQTNNVDDLPEKGCRRTTIRCEDGVIVRMFEKKQLFLYVKPKFSKNGAKVSLMTIKTQLNEHNMKHRSTVLKPLLSQKHVQKRLPWARENKDRDWSNDVFTDESSFWIWTSIKKAWSTTHHRILQRTVNIP